MNAFRSFTAGSFLLLTIGSAAFAAEIDFSHDIVPLLREHCGQCHAGDKKQGGFSLNTRDSLLAGGESGKAVVVGKSAMSDLIRRITSTDPNTQMPPEGKRVPAEKIALLKAWIDGGLKWDEGFAFKKAGYEPPLKPRMPTLPPAVAGRANPIDRIVDHYFQQRGVTRPQPIDDAMFARRVYLDLIGLLPEPAQLDKFLADTSPGKRERLIAELLGNDVAYAEHWLTFWNDLLRNDYTGTGFITGGRKQITKWLYESLVRNKPYDQFTRELIAPAADAEGFIQGIRWRGDVSASQTNEVQFAQSISQSFLGINMKCASCHDSFIDRWKLSEAYGLAAIYSQKPLAIHRCDKPTGETAHAAWIFPELGDVNPAAPQPERLKQLAALMTHPDNGRFTRTIVNRIWHRLIGRGIVHPVDAMHTEPWSPDLLDFLAVNLAEQRYDLKQTMAIICNSAAYQSQSPAQRDGADSGEFVFRGPVAKRMTAEQFVDAVWQLTGAAPNKPDAQVVRVNLASAAKGVANPPSPKTTTLPRGQWIWSHAAASTAAPGNETLAFRRVIMLAAAPTRATAVITCDNEYTLFVNGQKAQADTQWETLEVVSLDPYLKAGDNELLVVAKNGTAAPNPAALFVEARWQFADGKEDGVGSDATWNWSKQLPDARGRYKKSPDDWRAAEPVANPGVWGAVIGEQPGNLLANSAHAPRLMVRAALMKSDTLMRSLGRPNRDQIVSMRPSDLTTLEAIDLANGSTLADSLARGAKRAATEYKSSPDDLAKWLYQFALGRAPSDNELAVVRESLGATPTEIVVQDLLWAVVMLPEFQLVR